MVSFQERSNDRLVTEPAFKTMSTIIMLENIVLDNAMKGTDMGDSSERQAVASGGRLGFMLFVSGNPR